MADKKRSFKLFDTQRVGKGIRKSDANLPPKLKKFGIIYKDNVMNRLLYLNLMMIVFNLPILALVLAFVGVGQAPYQAPSGDLFSLIQATVAADGGYTPSTLAMLGVAGLQTAQRAHTAWTYVLYGIGALTLFTWGPVSCGSAYILRNLATRKPIFLWSDFIDTIRKNWKQALPFGIIDALVLCILPFNIYSMMVAGSGYLTSLFFWVNVLLLVIYLVMRWYVYLQIVSFRLTVWKMVKNAAYFVLLGWKRNLLALFGNVLLLAITLLFLLIANGRLIVIPLAIVTLTLFSSSAFMTTYAAWYKIDEIMVIHESEETEGPVMTDEG